MHNVSWSTGYYIRTLKKRWVYCKIRGRGNQSSCHWLLEMLVCHDGVLDYLVLWIVHIICCGPSKWPTFVLHSVRGPINFKIGFLFPMVWSLDDFQGSSNLHGHGSWFMYEAALSRGRKYHGLLYFMFYQKIRVACVACGLSY